MAKVSRIGAPNPAPRADHEVDWLASSTTTVLARIQAYY